MAIPITIDDLVNETRNQLDENNTESVSDVKIIRALNRAARNCYQIVAKQFDQLFMAEESFTTDGTNELIIPADAFGRRIEYITYVLNNRDVRINKVNPAKMSQYSTVGTQYPSAYTTRGNKIILGPTPLGGVVGTIHYMKKPATLVASEGRILSTTTTTITLDTVGSNLTVDVDDLSAFINVIDRDTGLSKGALQIQSIDTATSTLTFKTASLDRTEVYGTTILDVLPTGSDTDDYVCGIGGTCVLELISDYSDYLTQFAVVEIKRSLRLPTEADFSALKGLEKQVETIWAGRENDSTVTAKNPHWHRNRRLRRR